MTPADGAADAGAADEMRSIAHELRRRVDARGARVAAWARLWRPGRGEPWTPEAVAAFTDLPGDDPFRSHHLAVAHHARAWDAERAERPDDAVEDWERALRHWSAVHADDAFWAAVRRRLEPLRDAAVDAGTAAARARAALPAHLLGIHAGLALRHHAAGRTSLARRHAGLVAAADLPADDVDAARRRLADGLSDEVHHATRRRRFNRVFHRIDGLLGLDPTNPWLLDLMLEVTDAWVWYLLPSAGRTGGAVDELLASVERRVSPNRPFSRRLLAVAGPGLARFASWAAYQRLGTLPDVDTVVGEAELAALETQLRAAHGSVHEALSLDAWLADDVDYLVAHDESRVVVELAQVRRRRGAPASEVLDLHDRAVELDPTSEEATARRRDAMDSMTPPTLREIKQWVLAGDGPGAVRGLEHRAVWARTATHERRLDQLIPAVRHLVARDPEWSARLTALVARPRREGRDG